MEKLNNKVKVTGMGVITPIGIGLKSFSEALKKGESNFSKISFTEEAFEFPIGKVNDFCFKEQITKIGLSSELEKKAKRLRNISESTAYGVFCALEAWKDADFNTDIDVTRVAIISGGSNTQQASLQSIQDKYRNKLHFLNPTYGFNFFDTDVVGTVSEILGIKGEGTSIGAASASGNIAMIQGSRLIHSDEYDVVIVIAPMMNLSIYEYQGFTALGAMAKINENQQPSEIYKPFDQEHCGFVYGQSAGCIILESNDHASKRGKTSYGTISGYGTSLDANRKPNPSQEGEEVAMQKAIQMAQIDPKHIDYVNTHGTGSVIGDKTEISALVSIGLSEVKANSTKSLIGHGLSAAGVVESIASFIQMKENFLHINKNLVKPIDDQIFWVKDQPLETDIKYTMSNSFGFGGVNTSIILKKDEL
jgi:malonyl-ACP decarboxylase